MKRREFITLLGGAAAWPLAARAQQPEHVRLIGVLSVFAKDDPEATARETAFQQTLADFVHGVDAAGQRRYVLAFFQKMPSCLIGIEACASSHYWSRELQAIGHSVRLMPPAYVKPCDA
jgi:hypothetical protein